MAHREWPRLVDSEPPPDESQCLDDMGDSAGVEIEQSGAIDSVPAFPVVRILDIALPEPAGMVVPRFLVRDVNTWFGHGGHGKSTIVAHATIAIALGIPVFGVLPVNEPGTVILVSSEDGVADTRMMLDATIDGLNITDEQRADLAQRVVMIPDDQPVNLLTHSPRLGATAREHSAALVVIDPLAEMLGGEDENDARIAKAVCAGLRREVCRGAGAGVLLVHHPRKAGREEPDAAPTLADLRGSGGWANHSRLVLGIHKQNDRIRIRGLKGNRVSPQGVDHELTLTVVADPENEGAWQRCTLIDANAGAQQLGHSESFVPGRGRDLNQNERHALAALDDKHEPDVRFSVSAWRDNAGLSSKNTFKDVKRRLIDAGLVAAIPTGKLQRNGGKEYTYQITPDGRDVLTSGRVFNDL